jgi:protein-tyrosine-phosphatase
VAEADLVLTAARGHQAEVLALHPDARPRTFTVAQAGRLAGWMLSHGVLEAAQNPRQFPPDDPRAFVAPLAGDPAAWVVAELDAARGMAPAPVVPEPPRSRWRRTPAAAPHPDDVPDPHELGPQWHEPAAAQIRSAMAPLLELLRRAVV